MSKSKTLERIENKRSVAFERKSADNVASIFNQLDLKDADWHVNTPDQYAKEAYVKNVIAYRCIKEIADNIGALEWEVVNNRTDEVFDEHPLLELLNRPNPMQGTTSFFVRLSSFKQISGNSYVQRVGPKNSAPKELYVLSPNYMEVIAGNSLMIPKEYKYKPTGTNKSVTFPINAKTGISEILHIKTFNPLDNLVGQSPIAAAAFSIDLHNEVSEWNMRLLQNGARPSGALISKTGMSEPQRDILKKEFKENYQSAPNAGKPLVFEGDIEWVDMMLSPKDMDYINSKSVSAKDIAVAFRVPPILLNIGADSTFNNMKEARLSMIENTIIPEADSLVDELNHWLVPLFGDDIRLQYNKDAIPAIADARSDQYEKLEKVSFLTDNEKRKLMGFEDHVEGNTLTRKLPTSNDNDTNKIKDTKSAENEIETKQTAISKKHYHKYDPLNDGVTTSSADHQHPYIAGDIKTGVVQGHSHSLLNED